MAKQNNLIIIGVILIVALLFLGPRFGEFIIQKEIIDYDIIKHCSDVNGEIICTEERVPNYKKLPIELPTFAIGFCTPTSCPSGYYDLGVTCEGTTCTRECMACGGYDLWDGQSDRDKDDNYASASVSYNIPDDKNYCWRISVDDIDHKIEPGLLLGGGSIEIDDYYDWGSGSSYEWEINDKCESGDVYSYRGRKKLYCVPDFALCPEEECITTCYGNKMYVKVKQKSYLDDDCGGGYDYDSENEVYIEVDFDRAELRHKTYTCGEECMENEIIFVDPDYYICKNNVYKKILDVLELSDEEQARLLEIISQLETTVEQKAQIIADLTTTLEGQILMISELEVLTEEKAAIIIALNLNLEEQAQMIVEMEINVAEQALIIEELDLTIQEQGQLITQMEVNLATKAALIQLLQVENENQASLIAEMELSFAGQASIITALQNVIGDDAEIILNLYENVEDQALLITELKLERDELAALVASMDLSVLEAAQLINELKLTTEEQIAIITELELSLEQERELVNQLRATIEEQNRLIEELKKKPVVDFELPSWLTDPVFEIEWLQVWMLLVAGGIVFLIIISGGKRK